MPQPTLQLNQAKYKQLKIAAASSGTALVLGGLAFLQPFSLNFSDNANAESSSAETTVNLEPTITVWTTDTSNNTSSQVNIAADPDEDIYTSTIRAHVSTNNLTGYTLTIQSNSTDAKMVHENESITKTIDPLTGSGTSANSWKSNSNLNNMWGYSIGNSDNFLGVPGASTTATTIDTTNAPNNDNYTTIAFGAKADLSLPAGTYKDTVVFSAVANYVPVPIQDDQYLQDITAADCAATPVYDPNNTDATTFTVKDRRDNQSYRIRRLYMTADKIDSPSTTACWMVDNLKVTKTTIENAGNNATLSSDTSNVADDSTFALTASDNSTWCTENNSDCDDKSMLIDTDYGTLYNWYAATAGTGKYETSSGNTTASICPGKGITSSTWHLPTGASSGEWYKLFSAYQQDYGWSTISGISDEGTMANTWSTTIGPDFVYSGRHYGASNYGQFSTGYGLWWSSTAYNNNDAYNTYLDYNERYVGGATNGGKCHGVAVRCVLSSE